MRIKLPEAMLCFKDVYSELIFLINHLGIYEICVTDLKQFCIYSYTLYAYKYNSNILARDLSTRQIYLR